jgi:hypothetical protein
MARGDAARGAAVGRLRGLGGAGGLPPELSGPVGPDADLLLSLGAGAAQQLVYGRDG